MFSIIGATINSTQPLPVAAPGEIGLEPRPDDPWLFTDPLAKQIYLEEGTLHLLEHDIRTYALYNGNWSADELQLKRELDRLVLAGRLAPKPAFGHLSPHPTIYRALDTGSLAVCGAIYRFELWEDLVFVPWLERLNHPRLAGPLRIGRFSPIRRRYLTSEAFPHLAGSSAQDFTVLHQILYHRAA